jgi:photosystem II stability/assembly factor-like uncharacterized protein
MKKNLSKHFPTILKSIQKFKILGLLAFVLMGAGLVLRGSLSKKSNLPAPTEVFENEKGEQEGGYEKYFEESRKAALGENWKQITESNLRGASESKSRHKKTPFAGGLLQGDWFERGSTNVSGNMVATFFYPATEDIYSISTSGTLYKGGLVGNPWAILNNTYNFNSKILAVTPNGTSKRIITAQSDHNIYYSDNEGVNFVRAQGSIANAYDWGAGGKKLIVFNNGIMYYLQHVWLSSPDVWGSGYKLYRSADNGGSWTTVYTFNSRSENRVDMWSPFGSDELYVIDNGTTLFSLSGTASTLSTFAAGLNLGTNVATNLTGYKNGPALSFYALMGSSTLYKSTNNGVSWSNTATYSPTAWSVGVVANPWVNNTLYYGNVQFNKSIDGGSTYSIQNNWYAYYNDINLLHADIVSINPFQKNDGTHFFLIGNHGGIHYFPEAFNSTLNLTTSGLTSSEYYDVVTVDGVIFAGSQDQGNQRFAGGSGTSLLGASQLISGDYVRLNSSVNGTKYWQEYPGGVFHYYDAPNVQQYTTAQGSVYGTARTNIQQWVVPTCNWAIPSENSILVGGGGNVSGSTESHLVKMTYGGSGNTLNSYQYPFNFLAAGGGYITALDHSLADPNTIYVGLNNGKFYYSKDAGNTWTQSAGFTGPTGGWNYGSFIHASRVNSNIAYYSGAGGQIYKTTDGGLNFMNMSAGLPNTFVSDMVLNTSETLLFAATDAGPYVCVLSTGQWHSMATANTPVKYFSAVEYVAASNIVRFATFGRGVWDFQITSQPLPVNYASFDAKEIEDHKVGINWVTASEKDLTNFIVEKSSNGVDFVPLTTVKALNMASSYSVVDKNPLLNGINYYRIKSNNLLNRAEYTQIKSVIIQSKPALAQVYPTAIHLGMPITVNLQAENCSFFLYDLQGRSILQEPLTATSNQFLLPVFSSGTYFYSIRNGSGELFGNGKLSVLW